MSDTLTVQVQDAASNTAQAQFVIPVLNPLSFVTMTLPNGTVGTAYSTGISFTGGTPPYSAIVIGSTGVNAWSMSGLNLIGNPTSAETDTITILGTDSMGVPQAQQFNLQVIAQAATPTFAPVGGSYGSAQSVTISCSTPSSTIYYTTDGSTPTTGSTVYTMPVNVAVSETLKAIATAAGYAQSAVGSATYTIGAGNGPAQFAIGGVSALANSVAGTAYSYQLQPSFGTGPWNTFALVDQSGDQVSTTVGSQHTPANTFAVSGTGLVTSSGNISATAENNYLLVSYKDSLGATYQQHFCIQNGANPLRIITPANLGFITQGSVYTLSAPLATLKAAGALGGLTWSLITSLGGFTYPFTTGSTGNTWSIDATTGKITGTATNTGYNTIAVQVTDGTNTTTEVYTVGVFDYVTGAPRPSYNPSSGVNSQGISCGPGFYVRPNGELYEPNGTLYRQMGASNNQYGDTNIISNPWMDALNFGTSRTFVNGITGSGGNSPSTVLGSVAITNNSGGFSCTSGQPIAGSLVIITGTDTNGLIPGFTSPMVCIVTTPGNGSTTGTLLKGNTNVGVSLGTGQAMTTVAGTPAGLTFINVNDLKYINFYTTYLTNTHRFIDYVRHYTWGINSSGVSRRVSGSSNLGMQESGDGLVGMGTLLREWVWAYLPVYSAIMNKICITIGNEFGPYSDWNSNCRDLYAAASAPITGLTGTTLTFSGTSPFNSINIDGITLVYIKGATWSGANNDGLYAVSTQGTNTITGTFPSGYVSGGTVWAGAVGILRAAGYYCPLVIDSSGGEGYVPIVTYGATIAASDPLKSIIFSYHQYDNQDNNVTQQALENGTGTVTGPYNPRGTGILTPLNALRSSAGCAIIADEIGVYGTDQGDGSGTGTGGGGFRTCFPSSQQNQSYLKYGVPTFHWLLNSAAPQSDTNGGGIQGMRYNNSSSQSSTTNAGYPSQCTTFCKHTFLDPIHGSLVNFTGYATSF